MAEQQAETPQEIAKLKMLLSDRDWRLDNLYWIKDKDGNEAPFKRNTAQLMLSSSSHTRDAILKARQLGFSTFICLMILDDSLFMSNTLSGIIDITLDDAVAKLEKIKYAYSKLPQFLRERIVASRANDSELELSNGSSISVGTSYRGGTLQNLLISEYGKISAQKPDTAKEIRKGTIEAIPKRGKIWIESTAEGRAGEFYEIITTAQAAADEKRPLSNLNFKSHFFAWWMDPEYRENPNYAVFTPDWVDYFNMLRFKHGITLDGAQQAWYIIKAKEVGPDDIFSEYPSIPEEAFAASMKGAYYKREMTLARQQGRIGHVVPFDPSRPVNTFWDIGMDDHDAIGFHQTDGLRHRIIDYYEVSDGGLMHCINMLKDKQQARGFRYGKHYGPHDLAVRSWDAKEVQTRKETAAANGLIFTVVPQVEHKADAIEAVRQFLGMCWFDVEHCGRLVDCLDNYTKKWNKTLSIFEAEPAKNGYQHGADSVQQLARGLTPDEETRRAARRAKTPAKVSQWGR